MNNNHHIDDLPRSQPGCLDRFSDELNQENFYGLEYVVSDFARETKQDADASLSVDWYGLSDLIIE